jgi:hypothetical protein
MSNHSRQGLTSANTIFAHALFAYDRFEYLHIIGCTVDTGYFAMHRNISITRKHSSHAVLPLLKIYPYPMSDDVVASHVYGPEGAVLSDKRNPTNRPDSLHYLSPHA